LRPAPIVLHLDGLRIKIPFEEWRDSLADIEVFGRRLEEVATISGARIGGSTLIRILSRSEVQARDARRSTAAA
jgi:methyl coenzyme M reductase subunit C-like uncharacterized protein (methanogenesis marker protein 7)